MVYTQENKDLLVGHSFLGVLVLFACLLYVCITGDIFGIVWVAGCMTGTLLIIIRAFNNFNKALAVHTPAPPPVPPKAPTPVYIPVPTPEPVIEWTRRSPIRVNDDNANPLK